MTAYVVVPTAAKSELGRNGVTTDVHAELADRARRQLDRVREALHAAELACEPVDGYGVFELLWRRLNPDAASSPRAKLAAAPRLPMPDVELASLEDRTIPGPGGEIPVRISTPVDAGDPPA